MAAQSFWQWAQEDPQRLALVTPEGQKLTFGELGARVNAVSHGLLALGLKRGDTVAIQLGNEPAWVEVYMAVHQIGMYLTAINYHLSADETAYILENCEAEKIGAIRVGSRPDGAGRGSYVYRITASDYR